MDPEKKCLNFIFPTKYVIPKSLKFSHWPSKFFKVLKDAKIHASNDFGHLTGFLVGVDFVRMFLVVVFFVELNPKKLFAYKIYLFSPPPALVSWKLG